MNIYENRAVAFIDILGFRSLIRQRKERDILDVLSTPPSFDDMFRTMSSSELDFQVTRFSDSIVCSMRIPHRKNLGAGLFVAAYAGHLALEMLAKGILVRGAITAGQLYHREDIVFGPAMVDAYELESKHAHYPRIIVLDKLAGAINLSTMVGFGAEWWIKHQPFRRDFDGVFHLDILGAFYIGFRPDALRLQSKRPIEDLGPVTARAIGKICRQKHKDPRISTKQAWLASYLADCCKRYAWRRPSWA